MMKSYRLNVNQSERRCQGDRWRLNEPTGGSSSGGGRHAAAPAQTVGIKNTWLLKDGGVTTGDGGRCLSGASICSINRVSADLHPPQGAEVVCHTA